ncbi:MAG: hypothetical protein ABFS32_07455 [Bacteroidota bacterium]
MKYIYSIIILLAAFAFSNCERIDENEFPEVLSSFCEIESFLIDSLYAMNADTSTNKVTDVLPPVVDITSITPDIEISKGAVIEPASGVAQDFTSPVTYLLTARDGVTTSEYTVTLEVAGITSFAVGDSVISINYEDNSIYKEFLTPGQPISDIAKVAPTIEVTDGSTISPASGEEVDFTLPVTYTVTSPGGQTTEYLVTLKTEASNLVMDTFEDFDNTWTEIGMNFEVTQEGTLSKPEGGFAHEAGAFKNDLQLTGDFIVEAKVKFLTHSHGWATAGFFINGNLDGVDPGLVFCLMGDATNTIGIHKPRPAGWQTAHGVVDGANTEEWTILKIDKRGDVVTFYVNDNPFGNPIEFPGLEGNIGLMGEFSTAEFEYISYEQL